MKSDLIKKFVIGSKEYSLSRTELRLADLKKPQNVQTFKLNELDVHFEYFKYIPLFLFGWLAAYTIVTIILYWTKILPSTSDFLIKEAITVAVFAFYFITSAKKKFVNAWRIYYATRPGIALTVNYSKKDNQTIEQFLQALSLQIKHAEKPIDYILHLLKQYGMVTFNEYNKMVTTIAEQKTLRISNNIIDIRDHVK